MTEQASPLLRADTVRGTLAGTLVVLWLKLPPGDILETMVLAAIGAITSFLITRWLQQLTTKKRHKRNP